MGKGKLIFDNDMICPACGKPMRGFDGDGYNDMVKKNGRACLTRECPRSQVEVTEYSVDWPDEEAPSYRVMHKRLISRWRRFTEAAGEYRPGIERR